MRFEHKMLWKRVTYTLNEESVRVDSGSLIHGRRVAIPLEQVPARSEVLTTSSPAWLGITVALGLVCAGFLAWDLFGGVEFSRLDYGYALLFTVLSGGWWTQSREGSEVFFLTGGGELAIVMSRYPSPEAERFVKALQEAKLGAIRRKIERSFPEDPEGALDYLMWLRNVGVLKNQGFLTLRGWIEPAPPGPAGYVP